MREHVIVRAASARQRDSAMCGSDRMCGHVTLGQDVAGRVVQVHWGEMLQGGLSRSGMSKGRDVAGQDVGGEMSWGDLS